MNTLRDGDDTDNRKLAEALEQQAATSEILRVISRSQTDLHQVFETIVAHAVRLCEANFAFLVLYEHGRLLLAARTACTSEFARYIEHGLEVNRETATGRAVLDRKPVHVIDFMAEAGVRVTPAHLIEGVRTALAVPMLRDERLLGVIVVWRREVRAFLLRQIELLQTFADQAVIAIENVRLFRELGTRNRDLTEALEQQTATSDILRAISRSPTDVQPVFDTIAAAALKLCAARSANVFTFDGKLLHAGALAIVDADALDAMRRLFPRPLGRELAAGRAIITRSVVAIPDVLQDPDYRIRSAAVAAGFRSVLSVPLMRDGSPFGAIAVGRSEPGPFPEKQIALLQTFADQAVIAIENVRLFKELEARNNELTQALEQQTATSEILRVMSRSPTDVQPVFDSIASSALKLCGASVVNLLTFDGELLHVGALVNLWDPEGDEAARKLFPRPPGPGTAASMAVLTRDVVSIPDVLSDTEYLFRGGPRWGVRSVLGIPLMREGTPIGALAICRPEPGPFPQKQIALLQTFADQAVIAIENVRLFHELEEKSRQLEIASRHKSAFLANMSHELRTPLNAIIGFTRIVMRRSREQLEPKQYENLEKILTSGQNLLSLINAILDLAKVEAGRIEITAGDVELASMLAECMRTVEPLIKEGVMLVKAFDGALPCLFVDEEKLRQIVMNLLSNAARFTAHGTIQVRAQRMKDCVEIAVADTGIGIASEKLELIFEEFEQVDASSTREYGGTGLGLTIARRLARLMGGDIRAESKVGDGSTFILTLPLRYQPLAA